MNSWTILAGILALASVFMLSVATAAEHSSKCAPRSVRPDLNGQMTEEWEGWAAKFTKLFRGIIGWGDNVQPAADNTVYKEWDDFDARFSKMFRAYLQKDINGKTMYLPLNLTDMSARGTGESLTDLSESQYWDYTLNTDCATIDVGVTKLRPDVEIIYRPHAITYTIGDSTERCWFKMIEPEEEGTHAYSCNVNEEGSEEIEQVATLVIQRMDLDKFLSTLLPKEYEISWR